MALCAAAGVAALSPASAAAAQGGDAVLSVAPTHPDPSVTTGRSFFVHSVSPGTSWRDEVSVTNSTGVAISAWVDAVDGLTSLRTGAVYAARTASVHGAGSWVRPNTSTVVVAAHARTVVGFTVTVPAGASVGDHLAGIAVESRPAPGGPTPGSSVAITTVLRSVVAVQVVVPGPAVFLLHVYGAAVRAVSTTGTSGLDLDMADVGGLLGKPRLEIVITGPAGYHRAETVQLDTMLPGDRITDELLWPDAFAAGGYQLSITEDGAGRQGVPFVTSAHLAAPLLPMSRGHQLLQAVASVSTGTGDLLRDGAVAAGTGAGLLLIVASRRRRLGQRRRDAHGRIL